MKIFLDSVDIKEIEEIQKLGIIDGITSNPSLIAKSGQNIDNIIKDICSIFKGPVSFEVIAENYDGMVKEGESFLKHAPNVVIKLPVTWEGIRACRHFINSGQKVNMTLCFSANQAILVARAGATYVSPFVARLEDINHSGRNLIKDIVSLYDNFKFSTNVLAASIRTVDHFYEAAMAGAHIATMPAKLIKQLIHHPLTDIGLEIFKNDWESLKTLAYSE